MLHEDVIDDFALSQMSINLLLLRLPYTHSLANGSLLDADDLCGKVAIDDDIFAGRAGGAVNRIGETTRLVSPRITARGTRGAILVLLLWPMSTVA